MESCLYAGWVRHRRFAPVAQAFRYRLFQLYLDLDELPGVFRGRWLWSATRPALAWFRRSDHLGDPRQPLKEAVGDLVEAHTGRRPAGSVRLLTHPRYFGYCMNPVSFYYCFDGDGRRVETIVAEVHNTPWGERHCYVLPAVQGGADAGRFRFRRAKAFHVSPFMAMEQGYDWRFSAPGRHLTAHLINLERGVPLFDATLCLTRRPMTGRTLAAALARHPCMTGTVIAAIYWQAFRLWWQACPVYPHPRLRREAGRGAA